MAYDGIITYAAAKELKERIVLGKIEKVYAPGNDTTPIYPVAG
jgi:predicted ribosome quality control (RQC) complex YloA/Tae2 family protein